MAKQNARYLRGSPELSRTISASKQARIAYLSAMVNRWLAQLRAVLGMAPRRPRPTNLGDAYRHADPPGAHVLD